MIPLHCCDQIPSYTYVIQLLTVCCVNFICPKYILYDICIADLPYIWSVSSIAFLQAVKCNNTLYQKASFHIPSCLSWMRSLKINKWIKSLLWSGLCIKVVIDIKYALVTFEPKYYVVFAQRSSLYGGNLSKMVISQRFYLNLHVHQYLTVSIFRFHCFQFPYHVISMKPCCDWVLWMPQIVIYCSHKD